MLTRSSCRFSQSLSAREAHGSAPHRVRSALPTCRDSAPEIATACPAAIAQRDFMAGQKVALTTARRI
jgi:hypothetical protein